VGFRNFLPTIFLAIVCGLVGALFFVGTMVAFWQIIVPLASPSAQDWRRFVTEVVGGVFPIFWTFALYFIAAMSASVFLPKKSLDGRLISVCVIVYVAYAGASFWALSAVRIINSEGARIMASGLINPYFYPIAIVMTMPVCFAICFVRRIQPWNPHEGKRMLLVLPVAFICLAAPLYLKGQSIDDTFARIWETAGSPTSH
jgi:hypothetical protein